MIIPTSKERNFNIYKCKLINISRGIWRTVPLIPLIERKVKMQIIENSKVKENVTNKTVSVSGKGTITIRGKVNIVEKKEHAELVITEVPYQVNTSALITRIAELVRDKIIDGIADLREETSFQDGMKIVIELKRDANPNVVLNNLYKLSILKMAINHN